MLQLKHNWRPIELRGALVIVGEAFQTAGVLDDRARRPAMTPIGLPRSATDVPVYRGSTAQVEGLYPWLHGGSLPAAGAYIGVDYLTSGSFCCHPLAWLAAGLTFNPKVVITGLPGAGKSATIKALALRLMPYGPPLQPRADGRFTRGWLLGTPIRCFPWSLAASDDRLLLFCATQFSCVDPGGRRASVTPVRCT
jgi:hypothetical protein